MDSALRAAIESNEASDLMALCRRASSGSLDDLRKLVEWAERAQGERVDLRRVLRKQEHDFSTLFEIVGQTSARSLDLVSMQTYLLRTVSGHFTTPKLLIVRRHKQEDKELTCSKWQGLRDPALRIPVNADVCSEALQRRFSFFLDDLPEACRSQPEVMKLKEMGIELAVPLIQEVEAAEPVLEGFLLLGRRMAGRLYDDQDKEFLNTLGKMLAICLRNEALYRRAIIDDLTGVASRGHFDARLAQEINRTEVYQHRSIGLVMLDIDHFKTFNDTYGHQTGDKVLKALADVLVQTVRNVDLVARYGGEEFAIILLEIDKERVATVAERLRAAVERMEVTSMGGKPLKVTASFGAACYPDDAESRTELIQKSDQALYKAKDLGRNSVIMAPALNKKKRLTTKTGADETATLPSVVDRRRPSSKIMPGSEPQTGNG